MAWTHAFLDVSPSLPPADVSTAISHDCSSFHTLKSPGSSRLLSSAVSIDSSKRDYSSLASAGAAVRGPLPFCTTKFPSSSSFLSAASAVDHSKPSDNASSSFPLSAASSISTYATSSAEAVSTTASPAAAAASTSPLAAADAFRQQLPAADLSSSPLAAAPGAPQSHNIVASNTAVPASSVAAYSSRAAAAAAAYPHLPSYLVTGKAGAHHSPADASQAQSGVPLPANENTSAAAVPAAVAFTVASALAASTASAASAASSPPPVVVGSSVAAVASSPSPPPAIPSSSSSSSTYSSSSASSPPAAAAANPVVLIVLSCEQQLELPSSTGFSSSSLDPPPSVCSSVTSFPAFASRLQRPCGGGGRGRRRQACESAEFLAEAGVSLSSLLIIHHTLAATGISYRIATPTGQPPAVSHTQTTSLSAVAGGTAAADRSAGAGPAAAAAAAALEACVPAALYQQLLHPLPLRNVKADNYMGLLLPHHLGAAIDLLQSSALAALVATALPPPTRSSNGSWSTSSANNSSSRKCFLATRSVKKKRNMIICAVGYGAYALCAKRFPAAAASAPERELYSERDGSSVRNTHRLGWTSDAEMMSASPFDGYVVTSVSPFDECRYPFFGRLPYMLQELLEENGASFVSFSRCLDSPACVVDRNIITGPSEASTQICLQIFTLLLLNAAAATAAEQAAAAAAERDAAAAERGAAASADPGTAVAFSAAAAPDAAAAGGAAVMVSGAAASAKSAAAAARRVAAAAAKKVAAQQQREKLLQGPPHQQRQRETQQLLYGWQQRQQQRQQLHQQQQGDLLHSCQQQQHHAPDRGHHRRERHATNQQQQQPQEGSLRKQQQEEEVLPQKQQQQEMSLQKQQHHEETLPQQQQQQQKTLPQQQQQQPVPLQLLINEPHRRGFVEEQHQQHPSQQPQPFQEQLSPGRHEQQFFRQKIEQERHQQNSRVIVCGAEEATRSQQTQEDAVAEKSTLCGYLVAATSDSDASAADVATGSFAAASSCAAAASSAAATSCEAVVQLRKEGEGLHAVSRTAPMDESNSFTRESGASSNLSAEEASAAAGTVAEDGERKEGGGGCVQHPPRPLDVAAAVETTVATGERETPVGEMQSLKAEQQAVARSPLHRVAAAPLGAFEGAAAIKAAAGVPADVSSTSGSPRSFHAAAAVCGFRYGANASHTHAAVAAACIAATNEATTGAVGLSRSAAARAATAISQNTAADAGSNRKGRCSIYPSGEDKDTFEYDFPQPAAVKASTSGSCGSGRRSLGEIKHSECSMVDSGDSEQVLRCGLPTTCADGLHTAKGHRSYTKREGSSHANNAARMRTHWNPFDEEDVITNEINSRIENSAIKVAFSTPASDRSSVVNDGGDTAAVSPHDDAANADAATTTAQAAAKRESYGLTVHAQQKQAPAAVQLISPSQSSGSSGNSSSINLAAGKSIRSRSNSSISSESGSAHQTRRVGEVTKEKSGISLDERARKAAEVAAAASGRQRDSFYTHRRIHQRSQQTMNEQHLPAHDISIYLRAAGHTEIETAPTITAPCISSVQSESLQQHGVVGLAKKEPEKKLDGDGTSQICSLPIASGNVAAGRDTSTLPASMHGPAVAGTIGGGGSCNARERAAAFQCAHAAADRGVETVGGYDSADFRYAADVAFDRVGVDTGDGIVWEEAWGLQQRRNAPCTFSRAEGHSPPRSDGLAEKIEYSPPARSTQDISYWLTSEQQQQQRQSKSRAAAFTPFHATAPHAAMLAPAASTVGALIHNNATAAAGSCVTDSLAGVKGDASHRDTLVVSPICQPRTSAGRTAAEMDEQATDAPETDNSFHSMGSRVGELPQRLKGAQDVYTCMLVQQKTPAADVHKESTSSETVAQPEGSTPAAAAGTELLTVHGVSALRQHKGQGQQRHHQQEQPVQENQPQQTTVGLVEEQCWNHLHATFSTHANKRLPPLQASFNPAEDRQKACAQPLEISCRVAIAGRRASAEHSVLETEKDDEFGNFIANPGAAASDRNSSSLTAAAAAPGPVLASSEVTTAHLVTNARSGIASSNREVINATNLLASITEKESAPKFEDFSRFYLYSSDARSQFSHSTTQDENRSDTSPAWKDTCIRDERFQWQ